MLWICQVLPISGSPEVFYENQELVLDMVFLLKPGALVKEPGLEGAYVQPGVPIWGMTLGTPITQWSGLGNAFQCAS